MTDAPGMTRPMTPADYEDGEDVPIANRNGHPTRDVIVGAIVGATALWAVPRALDFATSFFQGLVDQENDLDDYDVEFEPDEDEL